MQLNRENIISLEVDNLQDEEQNNKIVKENTCANRYINARNLEAKVKMITWYRDSHGLFDYEEQLKITNNYFISNTNCKQSLSNQYSSVILKRDNEDVISEQFEDFEKMRVDQTILSETQKENYSKVVAACFFKDNNFWIFHKETIEDSEGEKANPGDKLWMVLRHMQVDKEHDYEPQKGYKLELGDTIKFGRVRYKVIMMQNEKDGRQEYALFDRFQNKKHIEDFKKITGYEKKRRNSGGGHSSRNSSPLGSVASPQRRRSIPAPIIRYQSQQTVFENGAFDRQSFFDHNESLSQEMDGSADESSNYTNSQVSEREEEDISDMNTVQQNGSIIIVPDQDFQEDHNINVALKPSGPNLNFALSRFNSIAPLDAMDKDIELDPKNLEAIDSNDIQDRRVSNQSALHDTTGLGKTGFCFTNNLPPSQVISAVNYERELGTMTNLLMEKEKTRRRKSSKKHKKNQKQNLLLKLQLAERAKLALDDKVCRICLGEENEEDNPMISPCKCKGTMSHIHLECLREWLNSKKSRKDGEYVKTYCWKALECELCQQRFPGQVFPDGTIVSDKIKLSQKQIKKLGNPIEILDFEKPDSDYIVIESVTLQNIRIIHVISMKERNFIRVGRGHDADIRVTDISVSRFHAKINRSVDGQFYVEDNKSKFGTLIQARKPIMLDKNCNNYIQMGRSTLQIRINDDYGKQPIVEKSSCLSCFKKNKQQKQNVKEISRELYPKEWNVKDKEEEEEMLANTQIIEQSIEGEKDLAQGPQIEIESQEEQEEEEKNNQIDQRDSNLDNNTFLQVDDHNPDGMQTGLAKNSKKLVDLGGTLQQMDFGGNNESSIMDNSLTDQTTLMSPQKLPVDHSRNYNTTTSQNQIKNLNPIVPINEVPQENEPDTQENLNGSQAPEK